MTPANQIVENEKGKVAVNSDGSNGRGNLCDQQRSSTAMKPGISLHRAYCILVVVVSMLAIVGAETTTITTTATTTSPTHTKTTTTTATTTSRAGASTCTNMTTAPAPKNTTTTTSARDPMDYRLPTDLVPFHYDLTLKPNIYSDDPSTFRFDGSVVIHVTCKKTTNKFVVHSKELTYDNDEISLSQYNIDEPKSSSKCGHTPKVNSYTFDLKREFLIFHLDSNLITGRNYSLSLKFSGPLKKDSRGLYLCSYKRGNQTIYLATSLLQPTDARKVFPCFDEPALKATFNTSIIRKSHMTSLSNMECVSNISMPDGYVKDTFQRTLPMSTYILAFVVSDFVSIGAYVGEVHIQAWTRPEFLSQVEWVLNETVGLFRKLQDYTGVPYPLNKLDVIGVPNMQPAGMENWGLIIYRDDYFVYEDPGPIKPKVWITDISAHEIAHMWYGNYLTPSWWDDIWLNEGFASFMGVEAVDLWHPTWNFLDYYRGTYTETALHKDALKSSHPVAVPVPDPRKVNQIFDSISYDKGAQLVKMMKSFTNFKPGLKRYLEANAYGDATSTDLWEAMSAATPGINVKRVMDTWVNQMNFPLVTLTRTNSASSTGTQFTVRQERFLALKDEPESTKYTSTFGYKWIIPVYMITKDNTSHVIKRWLEEERETFTIPKKLMQNDWILGNAGSHVFCRVNYDLDNWRLLSEQLKRDHTAIPTTERVTLIFDACALVRASYINITVCLDIASYFKDETEFVALEAAVNSITKPYNMLAKTAAQSDFEIWMRPIVETAYDNVKSLGKLEDVHHMLKVNFIFHEACYYGSKQCLDDMNVEFKKRMANESYQFDQVRIFSIICYGIEQGSPSDWRKMFGTLGKAGVTERMVIIQALACSKDPAILNEYLNKSISELGSLSDVYRVMAVVTYRTDGQIIAFNYFRDHIQTYWKMFGQAIRHLGSLLQQVCKFFNTREQLKQFEDLVTSLPDPSLVAPSIEEVRGIIKTNIAWMDTNEKVVAHWLKEQINKRTPTTTANL